LIVNKRTGSKHKAGIGTRYDRGFSLLEVIVALSILTICVSVLMRVFSGAVLATRTTSAYYTALEVAESRLAAITAERNPLGIDSGETDDGYSWRTRVTEYTPDRDNPLFAGDLIVDAEIQFIPYHFYVEVEWGSPRSYHLQLSTLRVGIRE
jgi:prepilin-type N-terminal cleavage/methylation domain-containing protein